MYAALHAEKRLKHVLVRHEQAAVHAAEGYARTTFKHGVVLVTSGPGMNNTTTLSAKGMAMVGPLQNSQVAVLATGGTFDKEYNEMNGELYFRQTHIPEMLALGRSKVPVRIKTLMMKDSLHLTDADRQVIATACRKAKEKAIVITHGTDTMEHTAGFLAMNVPDKTIVLTGAMIPYKFGSSDGLFNLGSALTLAQVLPAGIYVAMNGRYFPWDSVTKNRDAGVFVAKPLPVKSSQLTR